MDFGKLLKPHVLIGLIALMAIPPTFAVAVLAPQRRHAAELETRQSEEDEIYVALMGRRAERDRLQQEHETSQADLEARRRKLFGPEGSLLHERLESLARGAGVLITEIRPSYPAGETQALLGAATVGLEMRGTYHQIATFIDQLEKSGSSALITDLRMSAAADQPGIASAQLTLRALCRNPSATASLSRAPSTEVAPQRIDP